MTLSTSAPLAQIEWGVGLWRVAIAGVPRGGFAYRIDAEEAALRLLRQLGRNRPAKLQVLARCGAIEVIEID